LKNKAWKRGSTKNETVAESDQIKKNPRKGGKTSALVKGTEPRGKKKRQGDVLGKNPRK